ncbi:hypothetical protein AVEN_57555-1 [Araneus ventricosus]|uniref:Uncharacterized protein n=1 Tax=Araneus ventricosus TaxID=182803 RepID=A0A4Y2TUE0_ARAVE|nr:hypothetical protein AVEN_225952-1 [Araneus ventricosus]GBO02826.1 hypothetical protein AVEN_57555-1 [Araneus ventricosus]
MVSRGQPYSESALEISLPQRFLPQNDRKCREGITKRTLTSARKKLWKESVVECDIGESETVTCGANSQRGCVFGRDRGAGGI